MPKPSVLITNHKRPDFLERCIASCKYAGVESLVIQSTSASKASAVGKLHRKAEKEFPEAKSLLDLTDPGNNRAWIAGVEACPREWVVILHDDDILLPDFKSLFEYSDETANFFLWDAVTLDSEGRRQPFRAAPHLDAGLNPSWRLTYPLLHRSFLTFSPVSGCFRKEFLLYALNTFERDFANHKELWMSPTMVIGNDLLIWLLAMQHCPNFFYIRNALNGFGCHKDSISYKDHLKRQEAKGHDKLFGIYNFIRDSLVANVPRGT